MLNKISRTANLYSSFSNPNLELKSLLILLMRSLRLRFLSESLILTEILASSFSTEIY